MTAADNGFRHLSRPRAVREDRHHVTGRGYFVADIEPPGTLHVATLSSTYAHARITGIETAAAAQAPGVVAVLTGAELAKATSPLRQYLRLPGVEWRPLAVDTARYAGEWVVAVVAASRAQAEDAAELIEIDYEPIDPVLDPEEAMAAGAPLVHPSHGSNVLTDRHFTWGDVDGDFAGADGVAELRVRWNRNSTVPIETFGVVASWDATRRVLDVWASIQMPQFPEQVAHALGLPTNAVRVHFDVEVGGSYGTKRGIKHAVLAGYLAMATGRPVKFIEDRPENMHGGDFHGPDRIFDVRAAYRSDGVITSLDIAVIDDEGAYPGRSPLQLAKPIGAIVGPYRIGSARYRAVAVSTNKTGQVAVRGFGQSPTNYAIEAAVDLVASQLGMDRIELRRRNLIGHDEFPYLIPSGTSYDSGDYQTVLTKALEAADYEALVRRRDELRAEGWLAGIGIATCLEPGGGNAMFENLMDPTNDKTTFPEACRIRMDGDGNVTAVIGIASSGQSHDTLVATLVGEELDVDPAAVAVVRADSLSGFPSQSPVGSRMAIMLGAAVKGAARQLTDKMRTIAAFRLGVEPETVVYRDGQFQVDGDPSRALGRPEVVAIAHRKFHLMPPGAEPGLEAVFVAQVPNGGVLAGSDGTVQMYPCFSFEAHVVLTRIDPGTGEVSIDSYAICHDCGTVINPDVVRGMVFGGIAHGIGVALYEQFAYDESGQPLTNSFMDYLLPSAHEIPPIVEVGHVTPSPLTSHGQKGVGEAGYMGAPAAVAGAVNDALGPRGVAMRSLPMKPSDIWSALQKAEVTNA